MRTDGSFCQAQERPMVPMLAGQRIRMQQVRRRAVSIAPEEKKEPAMPAGEEMPMLTRQP